MKKFVREDTYGGNGGKSVNTGDTEEHRVDLLFPVPAVDHALDSVAEMRHVKINQQAYADTAQTHIRQELSLMNRMDRIYALHFDDNQAFDDQIDPVSEFDFFSVENHRQPNLARHLKAALSEFVGEATLAGAFQQPRPKHGVDVHGRRNDRPRNLVDAKRSKRRSGSSHPNYITQK